MRRNLPTWIHAPCHAVGTALIGPALGRVYRTRLGQPLLNAVGHQLDLVKLRGRVFEEYRPTAHDVFVCSFGKSGTNWMLQIALEIAHLGEADFDHVHSVAPWPDELARGYSVSLDDPAPRRRSPVGMRVIKTHLPWNCIPYAEDAKYVCVVRDPKDVVVSGYYFFESVLMGPLMPPMELWLEHFLTGKSLLGSWPQHTAGFWEQHHLPNVLFFTYEELQADLPGAVDRIARLMGVDLNGEQRQRVLEKSAFAYMRSIDHKFYPGLVSPFGRREGKMMRQGVARTSHVELISQQRERVDSVCRDALRALGSDFPYDDLYSSLPTPNAATGT